MTETNEPSYYEIALTNRQVLIAFVVILSSVLAAFLSGVWVGRKNTTLPSAEVQLAATATEGDEQLSKLDELAFFGGTNGDGDSAAAAGEEPEIEGRRAEKPTRKPDLSELLDKPRTDTTLAQDVGSASAPAAAPPPPAKREEKPAAKRENKPPSTDAAAAEGFIIQVFSTRDEPQAKKVLGQLRDRGFRAFMSPVEVDGQTMHRVRVGPFRHRPVAERKAREVRAQLKLDTWITAATN